MTDTTPKDSSTNLRKLRERREKRLYKSYDWELEYEDDFETIIDDDCNEKIVEGNASYSFKYRDKIESPEFKHSFVKVIKSKEFNLKYVQKNKFTTPFVTDDNVGLGLSVTPGITVDTIKDLIGSEKMYNVTSVTGEKYQWKLSTWAKHFESPQKKIEPCALSIEFSGTVSESYITRPLVVRTIDWVECAWPRYLKECANDTNKFYPKAQRFWNMSDAGFFIDFHVDPCGTSVWYHILTGEKVFWLCPPTDKNLKSFRKWITSRDNNNIFFGDLVEKCECKIFKKNDTFFIPSGWIYATYTEKKSLVVSGTFLHSYAIEMQLCITQIGINSYPQFVNMLWYVLERYVYFVLGISCINEDEFKRKDYDSQEPNEKDVLLTRQELSGLKKIVEFLQNLPPNKKNIPGLIVDPKSILLHINRLINEHLNDDPISAITGRPVIPPQVVKKKNTVSELELPKVALKRREPLKNGNGPQKKPRLEEQTTLASFPVKGKRRIRCGNCPPCKLSDCKECVNCKDMVKYGGKGLRKAPCIRRKCLKPMLSEKSGIKMMSRKKTMAELPENVSNNKKRKLSNITSDRSGTKKSSKTTLKHSTSTQMNNDSNITSDRSGTKKLSKTTLKHSTSTQMNNDSNITSDRSGTKKSSKTTLKHSTSTQMNNDNVYSVTRSNKESVIGVPKDVKVENKDLVESRSSQEVEKTRNECPVLTKIKIETKHNGEDYLNNNEIHKKQSNIASKFKPQTISQNKDKLSDGVDGLRVKKRPLPCKCAGCKAKNCGNCSACEEMSHDPAGDSRKEMKCSARKCQKEIKKKTPKKSLYITKPRFKEARRVRCKVCAACLRDDCGKCVFCCDMTKNGGANKLRKPCEKRQCQRPKLGSLCVCSICQERHCEGVSDASSEMAKLMECTVCKVITHPKCLAETFPDKRGQINDELDNSWMCPKCFVVGKPIKRRSFLARKESKDDLKSVVKIRKKVKGKKKRAVDDYRMQYTKKVRKRALEEQEAAESTTATNLCQTDEDLANHVTPKLVSKKKPTSANCVYVPRVKESAFVDKVVAGRLLPRHQCANAYLYRLKSRDRCNYDTTKTSWMREDELKEKIRATESSVPEEVIDDYADKPHLKALLSVFEYLDSRDLDTCSLVSKDWYRVSVHPSLWKCMTYADQFISTNLVKRVVKRQPATLVVDGNDLPIRSMEYLLGKTWCLSKLSLRRGSWCSTSALKFPCVFDNLVYLDLGLVNNLEDIDVRAILCVRQQMLSGAVKYVSKFPRLKTLQLDGSNVSDDTIELIGQHMLELEALSLSKCPRITDETLGALIATGTNLMWLKLANCPGLTPASFDCLHLFKKLIYVDYGKETPRLSTTAILQFVSQNVKKMRIDPSGRIIHINR